MPWVLCPTPGNHSSTVGVAFPGRDSSPFARAVHVRLRHPGLRLGMHPRLLRHSCANHALESSQDLRGVKESPGQLTSPPAGLHAFGLPPPGPHLQQHSSASAARVVWQRLNYRHRRKHRHDRCCAAGSAPLPQRYQPACLSGTGKTAPGPFRLVAPFAEE